MSKTNYVQRLVGRRVISARHDCETDPETGMYDEVLVLTFDGGQELSAFSLAGGYSLDFVIKGGT